MNNKSYVAFFIAMIFFPPCFATEKIVIQPLNAKPSNLFLKAKKREPVALVGTLQTIPMSGAKLTVESGNYGRVILFAPFDVELKDGRDLQAIEGSKTTVRVTGTMLTMCSERDLKAEVLGCRWMDTTKPISFEKM